MTKSERNRHRMMLAGNSQHGPSHMASLIIAASRRNGTQRRAGAWLPKSATLVSDQQIADMAACVRNAWGSQARRSGDPARS